MVYYTDPGLHHDISLHKDPVAPSVPVAPSNNPIILIDSNRFSSSDLNDQWNHYFNTCTFPFDRNHDHDMLSQMISYRNSTTSLDHSSQLKSLTISDSLSSIRFDPQPNYSRHHCYESGLQYFIDSCIKNPLQCSSTKSFLCHYCRIFKPYRTFHSHFYHLCIKKYDHFCPILWSDIGRNNYFYFILVNFSMGFLAMPIFLFLSIQYYMVHVDFHNSNESKETRKSFQCLDFFILWTFFIWFAIVMILGFHFFLMSKNMTTKEFVLGHKLPYIPKTFISMYSRRNIFCNVVDSMFPIPNDSCYRVDDIKQLLTDHPIHQRIYGGLYYYQLKLFACLSEAKNRFWSQCHGNSFGKKKTYIYSV
jgi:hypothetical protein